MHLYDAIRTKALLEVHKGDNSDYIERFLKRWYSTTFHTPLKDVDDILITEILVHFFESDFEKLSAAKRLKEIKRVLSDDGEEVDEEAIADEAFLKRALEEDKAKEKAKPKPVVPVSNTQKISPQSAGKRFVSASKVVPKK